MPSTLIGCQKKQTRVSVLYADCQLMSTFWFWRRFLASFVLFVNFFVNCLIFCFLLLRLKLNNFDRHFFQKKKDFQKDILSNNDRVTCRVSLLILNQYSALSIQKEKCLRKKNLLFYKIVVCRHNERRRPKRKTVYPKTQNPS